MHRSERTRLTEIDVSVDDSKVVAAHMARRHSGTRFSLQWSNDDDTCGKGDEWQEGVPYDLPDDFAAIDLFQ